MLIYESANFRVEAVDKPLVDRNDGGHISIDPKVRVVNRQQLSPRLAIELMRLTIVAGEAMTTVMNQHGVDIGRINYQDNSNWTVFSEQGPYLHIHLYGRAKSAKFYQYGQACYFPHRDDDPAYYERFEPLMPEDIKGIRSEMIRLFADQKYSDIDLGLSSHTVK